MSKWPKKVKYRNKVLAKIYPPCVGRESYRVSWYAARKRQMKSFPTYAGQGGAKEFAEQKVKELSNHSQAALLTPSQATDALAAIERLQTHYQATGRRISLLTCISKFCETDVKLNGRNHAEAVEGYLRTVATVQRKDLKQAVADFAALDEAKTKAPDGQRPEMVAAYARQKKAILLKFADMLPGHAVCDVTKSHIDLFISSLDRLTPKSRNHHRTALGQFIRWSARNDYLPLNHRLLEAERMTPEKTNGGETQTYTPKELRALLEAAEGEEQAVTAIGGLGGLRTAELLRLDWLEVWRIVNHVEVTAGKSKTRQRRLVEICLALKAWLAPFRQFKSDRIWNGDENRFHEAMIELHKRAKVDRKTNGLRHSFCSYHYALHGNENYTAQQAGSTPAVIHSHYKGLKTKKEAQTWFAIKPARTAKNVILMPVKSQP